MVLGFILNNSKILKILIQTEKIARRLEFACELQQLKVITPKCWTSYRQSNLRA